MRLEQLFTCGDSSALSPAYVWWAACVVVGLGLEIYSVLTQASFDLQAFGIGVGALMAGAGFSKKVSS